MDVDEFAAIFSRYGQIDETYLRGTYLRFQITKDLATRGRPAPLRILDVGAHWLFQSALYALDGHVITAADLPIMRSNPVVSGVAQELGIELVYYGNLRDPDELGRLDSDAFDLILFTEIIEHITFNPVRMWTMFHRLLKPAGSVIVTTPN